MTQEEIRDIAIDSTKAYYQYLNQNDKGIQEVDILQLEYLQSKDTLIKLRLSTKLFDTEAIFFKNLRNNKKYDTTSIKVIEYDNDKNILLVKPTEKVISELSNLSAADFKVISDLKFLVERLKIWYERNGGKIALPATISKHANDFQNIVYFSEKEYEPSENQKQSLKNIFTNPFSYIWGAPGTGKTQFVLSYAVLHYIKKGDKIAILAPTNNAIEQVLRGVIKMTDKAGVDRKQIIRLGTPSKNFAESYPEVCEEKGVQKKLAEIDKQINILERMFNFQNQKQSLVKLTNLPAEFDQLIDLQNEIKIEQSKITEVIKEYKKKEIEVKLLNENVTKLTTQLNKYVGKTNSIFHTLVKIFSSKQSSLEKSISEIEGKIFDSRKVFEYSKFELSEINNLKNSHEIRIRNAHEISLLRIKNLVKQTSDISDIYSIVSALTTDNIIKIKNDVDIIIAQKKEQLEVDEHLFSEYKNKGLKEIKFELDSYLSLREKLASLTTEERLKSVDVIACTLDGYIGRYTESRLDVSHIFLDEAGYSNIIKALTLFNHTIPISFLGDHKQLPPVCEINDNDIVNDLKFHNMFLWAQSAIFLDTLFSKSKEDCRNQYLKNVDFNPISISKTSLNLTYRFGSNLAQILAKHVYSNDFKSNNPVGQTKIISIDAKKTEVLKSRISNNEVSEIRKIVAYLKLNGIDDFVILAPYKKQIKLLSNSLPQERNDLKILTVHGSQGREWDTVILSVVDTSDKWFVDTTNSTSKGLNLVNTAVSRAKHNLIIVCDTDYWAHQNGQLITELINCGHKAKY
ncbi:MAG: AAA domain-containing protein [Candidatus Kapaibacterium sp.]